MVATRSSLSTDTEAESLPPPTRRTPNPKANGKSSSSFRRSLSSPPTWSHTPTPLTILWLAVSLPLVTWDFIYCLFRPLTMPGGAWHWPLWVPYALYGKVDYVYGWPALEQFNGFTSAQAALNVLETALYGYYLYIYWTSGKSTAAAAETKGKRWEAGSRRIEGSDAGVAALVGFSGAVMTCSKTILYWLCEYYSGYRNIGHNPLQDLILLWIIPNGAWLVMSAYMAFVIGDDLLNGLKLAAGHAKEE